MFLNTVMLNIWHPGRFLPSGTRTFLAIDGVERVGPGWEDTRPPLLKIFDMCDIYGLVSGRDKKNRYWEWEPAELEGYVARQKAEKDEKKRQRKEMWSRRKKRDHSTNVDEAPKTVVSETDVETKHPKAHDAEDIV